MKHISNNVLTIKDCSCDSVLRINLKEFFPATQTICKQLAKIIDAATEPEEIKEECTAYLIDVARIFIKSYDVTTARKYYKNITAIGGKKMVQKFDKDLASALVELRKEQAKVAAYANKVQEMQRNLQNACDANANNNGVILEKYNAAAAEIDELKAANAKLQKELKELRTSRPVVVLQDSFDESNEDANTDSKNTVNKSSEPETLAELIQIEGVTLQVNGRKTSSPVSWIYGGDEYKELLTKLGFKFSAKKDGYWIKGIAA